MLNLVGPTNTHNIALYDKLIKEYTNHMTNHWKPHKHLKTDKQQTYLSRWHIFHPMQRLEQTLHRRNPTKSRKKNLRTQTMNQINVDRNALFSHMLELKHTLIFSQATLIKLIHCKNSWRCLGPSQNKPYNSTSRILLNLNIFGEHHIKCKQNQKRKRIEKTFLHSA